MTRAPRKRPAPIKRTRLLVDPATSQRLARVRQRDTAAERAVRRQLQLLGVSYRVRNRDLPGSPDIANRSKCWAIFVHGCYWHHHSGCVRATVPKRNRRFWLAKFNANTVRDKRAAGALRALGYSTLVIWECELDDADSVSRTLRRFLTHAAGKRDA